LNSVSKYEVRSSEAPIRVNTSPLVSSSCAAVWTLSRADKVER